MSISRPLAAGAVMGLILAAIGHSPLSHFIFIAAGASILMSVDSERPGRIHSLPAVIFLSLLALAVSPVLCGNALCGASVAVGLVTGLLADSLNSSLYVWEKGGEWFSVMADRRWAKHGDAAISLVSVVLLMAMVVLG